jgi:hypothetical protein
LGVENAVETLGLSDVALGWIGDAFLREAVEAGGLWSAVVWDSRGDFCWRLLIRLPLHRTKSSMLPCHPLLAE